MPASHLTSTPNETTCPLLLPLPCCAVQVNRDQKSLMPVTVAQVLKAAQNEPDDHFRVDGVEIHQVGGQGRAGLCMHACMLL